MRRTRAIAAAVVFIVLVAAGVGLVFTSGLASPSAEKGGNLLANAGFERGNLQGWQSGNLLLPAAESTVVNNGTYAARFETTSNGDALSQCTMHALQCDLLNSSTISQGVSGVSISQDTRLSIALYPAFQYPSTFQMTLDFGTASRQNSQDVTIYYIFYASSEQCDAYSQLLVNASQYARAFCLSAQQGQWNTIARNISDDIPSALSPPALDGSFLTLSLSFAGGNSNDTAYVDSMYLG